jgi:hypothetical protein
VNIHAPTEDKIDVKDSFYEELECVFDEFPNTIRSVLQGFNAKVDREDIS